MIFTIYKSKFCAQCPTVITFLDKYEVPIDVVDIDKDPGLRQKFYKMGLRALPITTDGETYVVGYKPAELIALMRKHKYA